MTLYSLFLAILLAARASEAAQNSPSPLPTVAQDSPTPLPESDAGAARDDALIRVLAGRRRTPLTELCRAVEDRHGVRRGYRSRRPTTARQRRGHRAAAAAAAGNRAQTSPRRRRRRLPGRRLRLPIRRARRRRLPGRRAIIGGGADGRGLKPNLMT